MRHLVALAILTLLAADSAAGQKPEGEARSRRRVCSECAQDSVDRVVHKRRVQGRDQREFASLVRELSRVRSRLHQRELAEGERHRLAERAQHLESQLATLGLKIGIDAGDLALRDLGPALAEARRAMEAAAGEAGVAALHPVPSTNPRFPGWVGITLEARSQVETRDGDIYWKFFEHPRIVSVDPSSPAERAGIRRGDILLAYDGQDVRRAIAMNRVLQPGRTVRVRLRAEHDEAIREVPVKVAPARFVWREWSSATPMRVPRPPRPAETPWTVVTPEPSPPNPVPGAMITMVRINGLAGARVETITPGLGEAIGVGRGVLVISVPPGTPAAEADLADGDVILKADGRDIGSVQELQRMMAVASENAMRLDVARKGKVRQVTLRW